MKYSQELVWKSIYLVLPTYVVMRDAGVHINLTDAIKSAAVELFMIETAKLACPTTDLVCAKSVIFESLHDLRVNGWIVFGNIDEFSEVNNK